MTEDEMVGWHQQFNDQTLGDSEGQASLVCCSPRDHKESDMTYRLKNNSHIKKKERTTWTHAV